MNKISKIDIMLWLKFKSRSEALNVRKYWRKSNFREVIDAKTDQVSYGFSAGLLIQKGKLSTGVRKLIDETHENIDEILLDIGLFYHADKINQTFEVDSLTIRELSRLADRIVVSTYSVLESETKPKARR